jgi:GTP-dependent phosphoenolpyruvate carboxykinase
MDDADAAGRLLEVARKMAAVVGHAALTAVHKAQRLGKAVGHIHRAQRLAGLGRVDGECVAGKVLFLVVFGLGPVDDLLDRRVGVVELEVRFLFAEHVLVFRLAEQHFVVDDFFGYLRHGALQSLSVKRNKHF